MIDRSNQVWCQDITYIPMQRGFLYLVAIMDWYSRTVLSWRLSNSADVWEEAALAGYGTLAGSGANELPEQRSAQVTYCESRAAVREISPFAATR